MNIDVKQGTLISYKLNMTSKVSYNNLFKLLIDKGLKKKDFAKLCNLSATTMAKLAK